MSELTNTEKERKFWSNRYAKELTGWDIGYPSIPLKDYIDQLENKSIKILIPGAGNSYEAEYLFRLGFNQVYILDIAQDPLIRFQKRLPDFPGTHIIQGNFFEHEGSYDLILEQTFFCSFPPVPKNRMLYAKKMYELLKVNGKLVGLWFDFPLTGHMEQRPFGGDKDEYWSYLSPFFECKVFEKCINSIPQRMNSELFGIFIKKDKSE